MANSYLCKEAEEFPGRSAIRARFIIIAGALDYSKIQIAGAMAESADATDLKSVVGNTVRVRPPLAPLIEMSLRSPQ